jgi:hypothetical protein
MLKNYFDNKVKFATFDVGQKVLLWDFSYLNKGKNMKFQNLWLGLYIIAYFISTSTYFLKDGHDRLFSYTNNGSHLNNYIDHDPRVQNMSSRK